MDMTRIEYTGRKTYRDKASRITWEPGDIKPVTVDTARRLRRFAEFRNAAAKQEAAVTSKDDAAANEAASTEQEAEALQHEVDLDNKREVDQTDGMLMIIESMDKDALEAYASKYEVSLDKRKKVADLRAHVAGLVEQFGAR